MSIIPPFDTKTVREWVSFIQEYDLLYQSISNGASVYTHRDDIDVDVFYYGLEVAAGKKFFLFDRVLDVSEGAYNVDVVSASGGFSGGSEFLRSNLDSTNQATMQSKIYAGVTPIGDITVLETGFVDTGSGGFLGRAVSAAGTDGVLKAFDTSNAMLRVTRTLETEYTANLRIIGWERES